MASDLERAVELARESPLDRVVRLMTEPGVGSSNRAAPSKSPANVPAAHTGVRKSYMRGGKMVSGYQGKSGHSTGPKPGQSVPKGFGQLKVGEVINVGGNAYRVLAVSKWKASTKAKHVAGKTTGKNTASKASAATKAGGAKTAAGGAAAKAAAAKKSSQSVSPQKAIFGGAPVNGQPYLMLQQVSTGAKFYVHAPPTATVSVIG